GRKIKIPLDLRVLYWGRLMDTKRQVQKADMKPDELAVILYSGGTTGKPKGIMLSSHNFNCLAAMTAQQGSAITGHLKPGDSMLSILPLFHGFGLGVCIHTFLAYGGKCILVPKFNAEIVGKLIKKERPQYMVGVPTLYEALLTNDKIRSADLSSMKGVYAGGDAVPRSIKERFDQLLKEGGAQIELREGYGLTECVTVCLVMPEGAYREKSIGVPYPDIMAKIVKLGTTIVQEPGEEGEICISGPTVMLGYLDDPEETAKVLKVHEDGRLWLHTGDLGTMDTDGFFYFRLRLKRMLKVSGVSVYPSQVEDVLNSHPAVSMACVIGVPDRYQIQKVKAFIVLKDPSQEGPELKKELLDLCKEKLIRWAWPREIEFRTELPKTRVGKIAFTELEREELTLARERGDFEAEVRADIIRSQEEMLPREE
ncbi:MAG TPA: AMP-binding protein, partial [Spirochaetia bacterium]|nr:AMP-binding protein [Spirochaetia bacterium]